MWVNIANGDNAQVVRHRVMRGSMIKRFDAEGRYREDWRFFVTAGDGSKNPGIDFYRYLVAKGRKVIVISGVRKEEALKVALKTKMLNVLITHAVTAKRLLTMV